LGSLYRNNPIVLGDFEHLIQVWKQENRRNVNFDKIMAALDFAAFKHVAQVRNHADWVPYIVHPLRVVLLLWEEAGFRKSDLLAAAFLHEILEDTKTVSAEIEAAFGVEVLQLVEQLTLRPELGLSVQTDKMSREAKAIKLADRTQNLRDLLDHPPKVWQSGKVARFIENSQELLRALEGVNLKLERAYMAALDNLIHINRI
jgi:guanosine-3',5'-bis(diphosphate) 3'-pyrophosphohydrolase